jgi:hypothetical protein
VTILLSACIPGVTTRGACTLHKIAFCNVDKETGEFLDGETWETCKRKPRLTDATIDTLPRTSKTGHLSQEHLFTYKGWIPKNCPV